MIKSFSLTLTTLHGDPDMYLSTKEFPTNTTHERKSTWCGRFPDIIKVQPTDDIVKGDNLVGTYYVSVMGASSSIYSLSLHNEKRIEENGQIEEHKTPIFLSMDQPQRGVLTSNDDYLIYKFSVINVKSSEEIVIALASTNGDFKMQSEKGRIPSGRQSEKIATELDGYEIIYNALSNETIRSATYLIKVTTDHHGDQELNGMSYTFTLSYSIGTHIKYLRDTESVEDVVKLNHYAYFNYVYGPGDEDIEISLVNLAGDAEILASVEPNQRYPTKASAEFKQETNKTTDYLVIKNSELPEECTKELNILIACSLNIAVYSNNQYGASRFVIDAHRPSNNTLIHLKNGVPQTKK